ncbi:MULTISPECIES: hypothetical protein [unclassified Sphingopyxis]|uniref:hypothetical protein n=1 Tax=unclassified Sphingopyxis TaxID=2614943 RepID=UPI000B171B5E|nr:MULTISPECIES: hypothetical protein [unclassified Sphingopyxis]
MVSATFTGNSLVVTFEENPENKAELRYEIEYQCANKVVPHAIDQNANTGINPENGMRIYTDTLLYEEHVTAGLTRTPTIRLYTVDANDKRSGAFTVEASNPAPSAPSFQSEVSHNLIIMNFYPGTDSDFVGYHVWASETSPVAKTSENEKAFGPNPIVSFKAEPATTYYVRYSGYDAFGDDGAIENEVEITTPTDPAQDIFSELNEELEAAQEQLADLIETYGDTASASASAAAALDAKNDAIDAATAASASASSSSANALVAIRAAAALFPNDFRDDGKYFSGDLNGEFPADLGGPDTFVTVSGIGRVFTYNSFGQVCTKGLIKPITGRRYRVSARLRCTVDASNGGGVFAAVDFTGLNASFNVETTLGSHGVLHGVASDNITVSDGWITLNQDFAPNSIPNAWIRPRVYFNWGNGGTNGNSLIQVSSLTIRDVTEEYQAEVSASVASGAAVDASDSASSAATNASLSATYSTAAQKAALASKPTTFENGLLYHVGIGDEVNPSNAVLGTDPTYGPYYQVSNTAGYGAVAWKTRVPTTNGKKWKVRALVQHVSGTAGRIQLRIQYFPSVNSGSYVTATVYGDPVLSSSTPVWIEAVLTSTNAGAFITPCVVMNYPAPYTAAQRVYALELIDVDAAEIATTQAGIATTQATLANDKAAVATTQANLSAAYATTAQSNAQTLGLTPNARFNSGMDSWFAVHTDPASGPPLRGSWNASFQGASGVWVSNTGTNPGSYLYSALIPIDTSRKYKIRGRVYSSGHSGNIYIGATSHDGAGAAIGANTGHNYIVGWAPATKAAGWYDIESQVLTGEGINADTSNWWRGGTKQCRILAFLNYNGAASQVWGLDSLWLEDVTESESAATSASISTTQAAIATAQAGAAQTSAVLAASIGQSSLNKDPAFVNWTDQYNHATWYKAGTNSAGTALERVAGNNKNTNSPYSAQLQQGNGTAFNSIWAPQMRVQQGSWYVVYVEAEMGSGSWAGSGVLVSWKNGSNGEISVSKLDFNTDITTDGTTAGSAGSGYGKKVWSKLVQAPAGAEFADMGICGAYQYGVFGYSTATNPYKWFNVFKAVFRNADQTEVRDKTVLAPMEATVATHSSVLATHDTKLASYLTRVSAGAGTAELKLTALDSGGSAASQISLTADEIKLGTTGGGLTINSGVATFKGELNVGGTSGGRVNIFKNVIKIYDDSGNLVMKMGNLSL